jgi:hypothetical protein
MKLNMWLDLQLLAKPFDDKSAINLIKNPISHGKSKHIENGFHYLREQVTKNKIAVEYCPTDDKVADIYSPKL